MPPRVKQQLYHHLAQLLRAGVTFPQALARLGPAARGPARRAIARIQQALAEGRTVAEACAAAQPAIGAMECAVLTAVERAGALDRGLEQLAAHFGAMAEARRTVRARLAYPVFLLLLGALLLNAPRLVTSGGDAYLRATLAVLGAFAGAGLLAWLIGSSAAEAATFSTTVDRVVRALPLLGGLHRALAMSRFCVAYDLQLEAGINVCDALRAGASASRSGLVRAAVRRAVPEVRGGARPGPLLARGAAFDPAVLHGIIVGEESGRLDCELQRLAEEQRALAFHHVSALAEWLPRLFYLAVLGYLAWSIVRLYLGYLQQVQSLLEN